MPAQWMIYGATGYTGALIARSARTAGLRPVLAGRNEAKLKPLASALGLTYRVAQLAEASRLDETLRDIDVVLHVAGPFLSTARPLVESCFRTQTHYLDLTGELEVFALLQRLDMKARAHNVMLMPGAGFVIAPSDCLAARVARRLPEAVSLSLGISHSPLVSRGSARTALGLVSETVTVRRNGILVSVPIGSLEQEFDYGWGKRVSSAISWPDVLTAFHTTRIPNITAFIEVNPLERLWYRLGSYYGGLLKTGPGQSWLQWHADMLPEGPTDEARRAAWRVIVAEAVDRIGKRVVSRARTPDSYTSTAGAALGIVSRVLRGEHRIGFQTPASVYGAELISDFPDTVVEDLYESPS
jgi:short subunit dehydrogenase-like uncharacterized protein